MSRGLKIAILILFLVSLSFFVFKYYRSDEVCPPDKCQIYKLGRDGRPVGTSFPAEAGRVRRDFAPALPEGFPKGLPIDTTPVGVVESYAETISPDLSLEQAVQSTQLTYSYVSRQSASDIVAKFEQYLKNNGYDTVLENGVVSEEAYVSGYKISALSNQLIIVRVVPLQTSQSQSELMSVLVSVITSDAIVAQSP